MKNQPRVMKNHENQRGTMKNHENQPRTMKNHENLTQNEKVLIFRHTRRVTTDHNDTE